MLPFQPETNLLFGRRAKYAKWTELCGHLVTYTNSGSLFGTQLQSLFLPSQASESYNHLN